MSNNLSDLSVFIYIKIECTITYIIVIYITVRVVNFPARQLVSATMAQPSGLLVGAPENTSCTDQNINFFKNQDEFYCRI
jgi:hypothetical protein